MAERIASSLGVGGWVRNLKSGEVEVVCEGSAKSLEEFLGKIDAVFGPSIKNARRTSEEPSGEFDSFDIRF